MLEQTKEEQPLRGFCTICMRTYSHCTNAEHNRSRAWKHNSILKREAAKNRKLLEGIADKKKGTLWKRI